MKKAFNIKGIECLTQALDCGIIIYEMRNRFSLLAGVKNVDYNTDNREV